MQFIGKPWTLSLKSSSQDPINLSILKTSYPHNQLIIINLSIYLYHSNLNPNPFTISKKKNWKKKIKKLNRWMWYSWKRSLLSSSMSWTWFIRLLQEHLWSHGLSLGHARWLWYTRLHELWRPSRSTRRSVSDPRWDEYVCSRCSLHPTSSLRTCFVSVCHHRLTHRFRCDLLLGWTGCCQTDGFKLLVILCFE